MCLQHTVLDEYLHENQMRIMQEKSEEDCSNLVEKHNQFTDGACKFEYAIQVLKLENNELKNKFEELQQKYSV